LTIKGKKFLILNIFIFLFFIILIIFFSYLSYEKHQRTVFLQETFSKQYDIPKNKYEVSGVVSHLGYMYSVTLKNEPNIRYIFWVKETDQKYWLLYYTYQVVDENDNSSSNSPEKALFFEQQQE